VQRRQLASVGPTRMRHRRERSRPTLSPGHRLVSKSHEVPLDDRSCKGTVTSLEEAPRRPVADPYALRTHITVAGQRLAAERQATTRAPARPPAPSPGRSGRRLGDPVQLNPNADTCIRERGREARDLARDGPRGSASIPRRCETSGRISTVADSAWTRAERLEALPTVGLGVREMRVHTGLEYRVIYLVKFEEAVYVLHAFEKRSRRAPAGPGAGETARPHAREATVSGRQVGRS